MMMQSNIAKSANEQLSKKNRSMIEQLESRQFLSASALGPIVTPSIVVSTATTTSTAISGYTPAQLRTAYGITGDGSGQTIAIVDAYSDPNIASDLAVFDAKFGLSAPASFKQVSATGSTASLPAASAAWDTEIALDVEWAHAIAQKASIILVDAASSSLSSLMSAVNYARNISGVSVISMSWGSSEFSGEKSYDSYFTTPAGHIGITFVAASGDQGASGGAEWPAVSSNVLSVGGTTLTLSSTGAIASESAWTDSSGGASSIETLAVQSAATGSRTRTSPDVSYDANPNTGVAVYDSVAYDGYVGWQEVGGTSAGAPQWAAIIAIADTARVAAKASTLTTAQVLSDVYSIYANSTAYASDFHDITSGSSLLGYSGGGGFPFPGFFAPPRATYVYATAGYDTLTGVGSPKGPGLIAALTSYTATSSTSSASTATATKTSSTAIKTAFARGIDPFEQFLPIQNPLAPAANQSPTGDAPSVLNVEEATAAAAMKAEKPTETEAANKSFAVGSASASEAARVANASALSTGTAAELPLSAAASGSFAVAAPRLSYVQQFAGAIALPAAAASSPAILSQLSGMFRDAQQSIEHEFDAISSTLSAMKSDGVLLIAAAVADVALLVYCYGDRDDKQSAKPRAMFNDDQPIEYGT